MKQVRWMLSRMFAVRFRHSYTRLLSVDEIERSATLQWAFGALLFGQFLFFHHWSSTLTATTENVKRGLAVCWPYFQECTKLYFLNGPNDDYSRNTFYMLLYGIMFLIVLCFWQRKWFAAHLLFLLLFLWESLFVFVLTYAQNTPYHYYHILFSALLLLVPHKEYFLKLAFVLLYFLSATIKFDDGWILGTYFTSLQNGLPLLPDVLTPIFTNIVIFSQVIGCWFLLSRNWVMQRAALAFFIAFHLYSGIFVSYMYPSIALPMLVILFGPLYRHQLTPFSYSTFAGWTLLVLFMTFHALGFTIPTDRRLTLEGNRFGMFMFEANHQCIISATTYAYGRNSTVRVSLELPAGSPCDGISCLTKRELRHENDMTIIERRWESGTARYRCDPYNWLVRFKTECKRQSVERIALTLDHSINGGPFYRIVDEPDMCQLSYTPFTHNEWIRLPADAAMVGYPVKNVY